MRICAWCKKLLEPLAKAPQGAAVSHGICPSCMSAQLEGSRRAA